MKNKNYKHNFENAFSELDRTFIIAEIGVNHNGSISLAKKMIRSAKKAGADAVKFQTFNAERLVSLTTPKVKYQFDKKNPSESHYQMLKRLELSELSHVKLKKYCDDIGIIFLSTPYDIDSANFLLELGVQYFKTSSADLFDIPLQIWLAKTRKPVIISVGMSTIDEVRLTVDQYFANKNFNIALLHCVSNYPCSDNSLNLKVIKTLQKEFKLPIGFSDHSIGNKASLVSVALGAKIIEKHFTLDKKLIGPDHKASSNPIEFKSLVDGVRKVEEMMGDGIKIYQKEELEMSKVSKKSLHMKFSIKAGENICLDHLELKRPGDGILYKDVQKILGRTSKKDLIKGHKICFGDFN